MAAKQALRAYHFLVSWMLGLRKRMVRLVIWFIRPDSATPLGVFRIAFALFGLCKLWAIRHSWLDVYGQYGFVQWAITRGLLAKAIPHLGDVSVLLRRFSIGPDATVYLVIGVYCAALVLVALGVAARSMAAVAWLLELLLMEAGAGLLYGMDYFTHIGLFFLIIMPSADALSLPAWLGWHRRPVSVAAGVTRRILQLQMAVIYLSSGIEKSLGEQWWNGEAIWRALTLPVFRRFDFSWLASVPWLAMAIGWSVLFTEAGYGVAMWFPKARLIWFGMVVGMHLGIGLCMGMWVFSAVMIILNVGAFGYEAWLDARSLVSLLTPPETPAKAPACKSRLPLP